METTKLAAFASVVLLVIRLSVFGFLVFAVVHVIRNGVKGDRRQFHAVLVGLAATGLGAASVLLSHFVAPETIGWIRVAVLMPAAIILGAAIGISCYAGILLGDTSKGYWKKLGTNSRRQTAMACVLAAIATMLFAIAVFMIYKVPIAATPEFTAANAWHYACTTLTYSFAEEVFYRGWVYSILVVLFSHVRYNGIVALLASSIIFAAQHVGGPYQVPVLLNTAFAGVVFGKIFEKHGLIAAAFTHLLANLLGAFAVPYLLI